MGHVLGLVDVRYNYLAGYAWSSVLEVRLSSPEAWYLPCASGRLPRVKASEASFLAPNRALPCDQLKHHGHPREMRQLWQESYL